MKLTVLTLEQCEIVRRWRNDCLETLRTSYPLTREMQAEFYHGTVSNRNSNDRYWAIVEPKHEETGFTQLPPPGCMISPYNFLGMGGITNIQWENRIGEISLIIDPDLRSKGYGEKAVDLLLDISFNQIGLNCVYGECYTSNPEGAKFWEKIVVKYNCGPTATLRARKFWDGEFFSSIYFDILKDEYEKAKI